MKKLYFLLIAQLLFSPLSANTTPIENTGLTEHIFEIDGRKRLYYLHLPEKLTQNAPLVFTLHGYGGTAKSMIDYANMNEVANKNGFAVCYPQGFLGTDGKNSWNARYSNDEVNDVKFLIELAKHLQTTFQLSAQNTFSTGMSNGADMSYMLACHAPDVFAAVAPIAGCMMQTTFDACTSVKTVPILEIHGDKDDITLWDGDKNYSEKYGAYLGTETIIDFWVKKNQTTQVKIDTLFDFDKTDGSYVVTKKHFGGSQNNQVWLYKLVGGKHDWPGTWGNKDIQTSEVIWDFFEQFLQEENPNYAQVATHFTKSTPEAEGVSSEGILNFIQRVEKEVDALHSFMIIRNGKQLSSGWWTPYGSTSPHVMHSLSKSFTSTAIGLLADEGKISLNDKVLSFFPEYAPEKPSWQWNAMRIRDLLTMNTGHIEEPLVWFNDGDWAKFFVETDIPLAPGTHFKYNSAATYMLSAILQKITGEKVVDYLTPRLFDPLKIKKPRWDVCPKGINTGGWGLSITTEDIAKLGQLYLQKGKWNGQQLISKNWVEMATSKQVSNGSDPENDWNQGYGFQFWQCRHNAYRGDGAMGQYCIVLPELDAVIAITSGVFDMGKVMNLVWEELLPAMQANSLPSNSTTLAALTAKTKDLKLAPIQGTSTTTIAKKISKKKYTIASNELGIQSIDFKLHKGEHSIKITRANGELTLPIGQNQYVKSNLSQHLPYTENLQQKVATSGAWIQPNEYQLRVYLYEMPARITYTFRFEADRLEWDSKLEHSLLGPQKQPSLTGQKN
ncbi:MAG: serine hydrolase [Saprospiraceae bacterium]